MLLKTKLLFGELRLFGVAPLGQALFANLFDGGEQRGLDVIKALGSGRSQADVDGK